MGIIIEGLKEHFVSFIGMVLSGVVGWFFGRPKQTYGTTDQRT